MNRPLVARSEARDLLENLHRLSTIEFASWPMPVTSWTGANESWTLTGYTLASDGGRAEAVLSHGHHTMKVTIPALLQMHPALTLD